MHHIADAELLWEVAIKSALGNCGCLFDASWYIIDNKWAEPLHYDTCPDTPSAVDYLAHIPHHEAISYLLADKEGRIARVEAAPEGVDVALEDNGMLSAVNCFQAEGMAHLVRVPGKDDSVHRYRKRIAAWYDEHKGRIDLHDAQRLCSDHEVGLCDHGEAWPVPGGTIYSWVVELGTGQVHVAHGRPCQNEYQVITLEGF